MWGVLSGANYTYRVRHEISTESASKRDISTHSTQLSHLTMIKNKTGRQICLSTFSHRFKALNLVSICLITALTHIEPLPILSYKMHGIIFLSSPDKHASFALLWPQKAFLCCRCNPVRSTLLVTLRSRLFPQITQASKRHRHMNRQFNPPGTKWPSSGVESHKGSLEFQLHHCS